MLSFIFKRQCSLRALLAAIVCGALWATVAPAGAGVHRVTKVVRFHGYALKVPASWPVYRLRAGSTVCVRFNRHAVYLGRPGARQRCPAHAAGRTEAILVEPLPRGFAGPYGAGVVDKAHRVLVTGAVAGALRGGGGAASAASRAAGPAAGAAAFQRNTTAHASSASAPGAVYTGLGFDACATPSTAQMAAWGSSPYRAIGVYIRRPNKACAHPNLTARWVSEESGAGWHLIPIYVGLQAPTNSCGCASISPPNAASQGAAAAADAVAQAQAVGLGQGNPLYFDMEGYGRTSANSNAVLTFLASWTAQLHASGYKSGVYSSAASGIRDLVASVGTGYSEPDELWIANWNGSKSTSDPNVPSGDWSEHQRIHQYDGGHDETHGNVRINIDGDYVDSATAAFGGGSGAADSAPRVSVTPAGDGSIHLHPTWNGASGIADWQVIAGADPSALAPVSNPLGAQTGDPIVVHSAFPYFGVRALDSSGAVLGTSAPVATPDHVAIYGRSVFVSSGGTGGVPVGCAKSTACSITTTLWAGRTRLRTGAERVRAGGGLVFFHLSRQAMTQLARARGHRANATIAVHEASGLSAKRRLTLVAFTTSGSAARSSVSVSPALRLVGLTDFVSRGWVGGILTACVANVPCHPAVRIVAGGRVLAQTTAEFLGARELGYVFFSLTPAGHRMLMSAHGNQLGVQVTVSGDGAAASGHIALVRF